LTLAIGACGDPSPLPMDFVRALEECPIGVETCVVLHGPVNALGARNRWSGDRAQFVEVETTVVGRLGGGHWRPIELRFRAFEPAFEDGDFATFAAFGPDKIATTHGALELLPGALRLGNPANFLLVDPRTRVSRLVYGPNFDWAHWMPEHRPAMPWLAFVDGLDPVWIVGGRCLRMVGSGDFTRLASDSCRRAEFHMVEDDEAFAIDALVEASGYDPETLDPYTYRVGGAPFYIRFARRPDPS
jgi:hypothetical protein